jgi:hypothetical protein
VERVQIYCLNPGFSSRALGRFNSAIYHFGEVKIKLRVYRLYRAQSKEISTVRMDDQIGISSSSMPGPYSISGE